MKILGIGGVEGDAACAVLINGKLSAAVEQSKIARRRRPSELPAEAINECLRLTGLTDAEIDCVAISRPFDAAVYLEARARFASSNIVVCGHHTAHAASAYFASGFTNATVLTLDRAGDVRCGGRWHAEGSRLNLERELNYPDSIGDLYGRVTSLLGFEPGADEHKVQWLSTFGEATHSALFHEVLSGGGEGIKGWPLLARQWFDGERRAHGGFSAAFHDRLGLAYGRPVPDKLAPDIAASLQTAIEEKVVSMAGEGENLCLAGGLHFNVLLVAALEASGRYKNVFVQPAAGNTGTALGAAYYAWHIVHNNPPGEALNDLFLGPEYTAEVIKKVIENCKLSFRYLLTTDELISTAVSELRADKIVAWMQGRMEFGPRALGNRSILASPLNPYSSENLNTFIKHREPFRKFAASVPAELAADYFDIGSNARFLATIGRVKPEYRKTFESAVLGDGLIRVHTVSKDDNPLYWRLLHEWKNATGLPVLYNTSFNLFGDPLVCSPRDAVRSYYSSGIDTLFAGHFLLQK